MIKYIVQQSNKNGQWYPRAVASNGKVFGKEGYMRKAGALRAVRLMQSSANAQVIVRAKTVRLKSTA
jgi:uncharacterized protein YegP (UPF0339 family)